MTSQPPDPPSSAELSLAARLARVYGEAVDPKVDLATRMATPAGDDRPAEPTLQRLGSRSIAARRYRVQREIARGGMGAILEVFDEDLRQRLAMKVVLDRRTGAEAASTATVDPVALSRFLEEAQVTGQLDHPGIVPVHELGLDESGRVYFTMRLVEGQDLEAICSLAAKEEAGWSVTRVLGVLLKVCEAMAFAHDKGVVHRDLKPANVMVGRFGEAYVMDWGLARVLHRPEPGAGSRTQPKASATDRDAGASAAGHVATDRGDSSSRGLDDALRTTDGDVLGTPSYMPPEQARGDLEALDARADVYATGAMLYRLLAGAAPYTEPGQRPNATAVWRRVLQGPPAPIERVAPTAPPELHAICSKAMARAATDRYPDMLSLADDLRSFLEGRVVQAFDTGALATARKWVQRNRGLAAAMAAAVLALVGGLIASLTFASRAERNAALAAEQKVAAEGSAALAEQRREQAEASAKAEAQQARIAQEVNAFLNDDLLSAIAPEHMGKDVTVRQVLDSAARDLDGRFPDAPEVESALRTTIGTSYERLGAYEQAHVHLERALELRRRHAGARSEPVLKSLRSVAAVVNRLGRTEDAIRHYEAALELAVDLLGEDHQATLATHNDLGAALTVRGRLDEARTHLTAALEGFERTAGADAPNTVSTRNNLALLDQRAGKTGAATTDLRRVHAERLEQFGVEHPETQVAAMNLAVLLSENGEFEEAERLGRDTLALRREQLDPGHPLLVRAIGNLGTILHRRGNVAGAEALFREALEALQARPDADPAERLWMLHNLSGTLLAPGQQAERLALRQQVADGRAELLGPEHEQTLVAQSSVAQSLVDQGRIDEAAPLFEATIERMTRRLGAEHPETLNTREHYAGLLRAKGDLAADEAVLVELLEIRQRTQSARHPAIAHTHYNLAMVRKERGNLDGALASATEALATARTAYGERHPLVADSHRLLGDLALQQKRPADAVAAYEESVRLRRARQPDAPLPASLQHQLGFALFVLGKHAEAEPWFVASLATDQARRDPDAKNTRSSLLMLARTLLALGRHAEAETAALDLLERARRAEGEDGEMVGRTRALLVEILTAAGRPEDAARWR